MRQKFTQKERDNETGLDYFGARYYASTQGRFTSADEFAGGPTELFAEVAAHNPTIYADLAEPQSLNKYHYCLNNPFRFVDPDGHQTKMADRVSLPTDALASKILKVAGQVRDYTNNALMGPVGARASDVVASGLDQAVHAFNQATYGPLGDTVNAIQDNPTVQVVTLAAGATAVAADLASARSASGAAAVAEGGEARSAQGSSATT